jgi:Conserved membrane protein YqhR
MTNKLEQNKYYSKSTLITNVVIIGFFGGVIASFLGLVVHYLNFMDFTPKFILTSWSNQPWIKAWQGALMTLLLFGILSIVVAFLYYALLRKMKSIISYILFGIVCWLVFLFMFKPMFNDLPALSKMSSDSIITSICLFALYGVFIGYSISFDYQEYSKELDGNAESESSH